MKKIVSIFFCLFLCLVFCSCEAPHEGLAARVNGVEITEDKVSRMIEIYRNQTNLVDDKAWKDYLANNNKTAKDIRNDTLDTLINNEVKRQIAKEKDITVSQEEINQVYNPADIGCVTEEEYKKGIEQNIINNKVNNKIIDETEPSSTSVGQLLLKYSDKLNGSTGYYQIMFKDNEKENATKVYNEIKNGKNSFEDIASRVTAQDKTGLNFDYVIYDCMIINPEPAKTRLTQLNVGEISEMITAGGYIYIFKVVDKIHCASPLTKLSDLSDFTQENLRYYSKIEDGARIFNDALNEEKAKMNIVKYDPPANLPYS